MTSYGSGDRISDLPDPLLCHILSFLPTKQAVSTSTLSTRWRYLFTLVPNFDLDDSNMKTRIRNFLNFVDRLLLFQARTTIEKLRLRIGNKYNSSHIHSWIFSAVFHRGVQQLDLEIRSSWSTTLLPAALFTCKMLVVLKIDIINFVLKVPINVCLPNLKTLHLVYIKFLNDDSVPHLISGCTMLEDFVLDNCEWKNIRQLNICHPFLKRFSMSHGYSYCTKDLPSYWIVINAPSLVYLKHWINADFGYSLVNLHSLVEAEIRVAEAWCEYSPQACQLATKFLKAIANVKSLTLSTYFLRLLTCKKESLPVLEKLVELEILADYRRLWIEKTEWILNDTSMPNLERLILPQERLVVSYILEKGCFSSYLKRIRISYFSKTDKLENIKCFLKNATVLEKLTIKTFCLDEEEKSKIAKELLAAPRKSQNCCILVL